MVLQTRVFLRELLEGAGLPGDRIEEVARLGVGGGEGPQVIGIFPVGEDAGAGCLGDGLGPGAELLVGAGRPDPGPAVVRRRVVGRPLENPVEVFQGVFVLAQCRPGPGPAR